MNVTETKMRNCFRELVIATVRDDWGPSDWVFDANNEDVVTDSCIVTFKDGNGRYLHVAASGREIRLGMSNCTAACNLVIARVDEAMKLAAGLIA